MNRSRTTRSRTRRTGFTLIEMLMAVTLVLIMMTMFAEVFQLAGGSVTKQRTLADNDQNSRTLVTILKRDLDQRTFRSLVPFYANEPIGITRSEAGTDNGYFYISNNYLGDYTDDVLQFTMSSTINVKKVGESKFYGAAVQLPYPAPAAWSTNPATRVYHFLRNPNQPDGDDGEILSNGAGSSTFAEVSYFMRGSRLYRRVMLIRDPIKQASVDSTNPGQPTISEDFNLNGALDGGEDLDGSGGLSPRVDYFRYAGGFGNFWTVFDYSAFQRSPMLYPPIAPVELMPPGARFAGAKPFLENRANPAFPGLMYCYSLGQTWNRFGFNSVFTPGNNFNGLSREFSGVTAPNFFLGRFTQEETSYYNPSNAANPGFLYPQLMPPGGNPMDAAATTFTDATSDGVVDQFAGGSRAGVDLLLSNVHEFRVEVWDERLQDFAPIGHSLGVSGIAGDYGASRMLNKNTATNQPLYGPLVAAGTVLPNVFDTWHPLFNRNMNGVLGDGADRPPFRPVTIDPTGVSGSTYANPSGAPIWWTPNTVYQPGDMVFPRREDLNGNGFLDPGEDGSNGFPADGALQEDQVLNPALSTVPGAIYEDFNLPLGDPPGPGEDGFANMPANGVIDTNSSTAFRLRQPLYPTGLTYRYVCVRTGTTSAITVAQGRTASILDEPNNGAWSTTPEFIIKGRTEDLNNNGTLDPGEPDYDGDGVIDREPDWLVVYNARPLRAIRITVRFQHPTSQQMKQVTIVHSLRDTMTVP